MNYRIIFFSFLTLSSVVASGQEFSAMSYNIKYDNTNDTVNNWNDRKEDMVRLIKYYEPQFLGMQEVLHRQLTYLDEQLGNFSYVGVGRDNGKEKGEYSPILYDTKVFKLLKSETFWLSDTPDKISVGWDASMERICTYALFEHKTNKEKVFVFNTHFDHIGTEAREKSAELIAAKIKELNIDKNALILMGDLNLPPETAPIQFLQTQFTDGLTASKKPFYGPTGTFSGFDHNRVLDSRIDYIFTENLKVEAYMHIDDRMKNNKHVSDHLPVLAKLAFE